MTPHGIETDAPWLKYRKGGDVHRVDCDFITGCDGFHGVSRQSIPASVLRTCEKVYPFGWLGVLSRTPPVTHEVTYNHHERGFALCSMRSKTLSRYYVQCPLDDDVDEWPDDRFWDELRRRLPGDIAPRPWSPARRSRRASRRSGASWPSPCVTGACFSPATPRTSFRRPGPRG